MASEPFILLFALPATANNLERCRRLGAMFYTPGLTNADRLAIWNGTRPYDASDPVVQSYTIGYSGDGGNTITHYLGGGQVTAAVLSALAARIGDLAALNVKYAVIDATSWVLSTNHNVSAFVPLEGTVVSQNQLLAVAGLVQMKPSGGGLSIRPS